MRANPKPDRELKLEAYNGRHIPNYIDIEPSDNSVALARNSFQRLLLSATTPLGPPTGRYNCHGLVFGSRRTNIPPAGMPEEISSILDADQFERVQSPQVGDIVIYRNEKMAAEHSGFVSRIDSIGIEKVIFVWSMWGGLGEFEHRERATPYDDCTLEYWRLKR